MLSTMSDMAERLNAALEGRYAIERELGEGGMATVYLADDLKHERKVALKVLKPELAAVVGAERFLAEIKTTANLTHPHILPLFDSGEADSFLYYVMPFVEGETLRDRLDRETQLPVDDVVRIGTAVANALDYAHRNKVVHRDIKPANILLHDGEPVVADFGIGLALGAAGGDRLTATGLSVGTPQYMSPEQAAGDRGVGPPTDVYALGCVLYEMLVGEPPYTGTTAQAILAKILMGASKSVVVHRPSVPPNVDAAIGKALEKLPADRLLGGGGIRPCACGYRVSARWGASSRRHDRPLERTLTRAGGHDGGSHPGGGLGTHEAWARRARRQIPLPVHARTRALPVAFVRSCPRRLLSLCIESITNCGCVVGQNSNPLRSVEPRAVSTPPFPRMVASSPSMSAMRSRF